MANELEKMALEAMDRFMETFNSRSPEDWSLSLQYPHVRVSARVDPRIAMTAEEYAACVAAGNCAPEDGTGSLEWNVQNPPTSHEGGVHWGPLQQQDCRVNPADPTQLECGPNGLQDLVEDSGIDPADYGVATPTPGT